MRVGEVRIGGIRAQRQREAVRGGRADQRGTAHLHRADCVRGFPCGRDANGHPVVWKQCLIDDLDDETRWQRPQRPEISFFHDAIDVQGHGAL